MRDDYNVNGDYCNWWIWRGGWWRPTTAILMFPEDDDNDDEEEVLDSGIVEQQNISDANPSAIIDINIDWSFSQHGTWLAGFFKKNFKRLLIKI